jgi:hypothetical protein
MSFLADDHDFTLFLGLVSALLLTLFSDLFLTLCSPAYFRMPFCNALNLLLVANFGSTCTSVAFAHRQCASLSKTTVLRYNRRYDAPPCRRRLFSLTHCSHYHSEDESQLRNNSQSHQEHPMRVISRPGISRPGISRSGISRPGISRPGIS